MAWRTTATFLARAGGVSSMSAIDGTQIAPLHVASNGDGAPGTAKRPVTLWGRSSRRTGQGDRRTSMTLMGRGSIPAPIGVPPPAAGLNPFCRHLSMLYDLPPPQAPLRTFRSLT